MSKRHALKPDHPWKFFCISPAKYSKRIDNRIIKCDKPKYKIKIEGKIYEQETSTY